MTKNPFVNALGALVYIILVVSVMAYISNVLGSKPDTFFAPIVFISILTLSVSTMAYMFFYQPLQLLVGGKKKEAVSLFTKTVGVFAIFTTIALALLLLGLI